MADTRSMPAAQTLGGRYTLGPLLGRGGMAVVHRAYDARLGREVAVKLFRPDVAEARDLRRVRSEIRTLASLNHPGLVTLHDAADGDDGSPAYLVLELIDGPDLASLLREDELDPQVIASLIADVAGALAYIHARGIVHRDIKPENILVFRGDDDRLHAKLADLGIARIVDESHLTEAGAVIGTAAYLSPEQVTGARVGTATDVYALGLVLLEALTGERPFGGTRTESMLVRTTADVRLPEGLDEEDEELLAAMTERDPAARVPASAVERGLRRWQSTAPIAFEADPFAPTLPHDDDADDGDETGEVTGARTEVLGADRTRVLPVAAPLEAPAGYPPPDARTRVLPQQGPPTAATEVFRPTQGPPSDAWIARDSRPARDTWPLAEEPRQEPPQRTRRFGTVFALVVVVLALLAALTVALWPVVSEALAPARPPVPAYPTAEGELGEHLAALQASVGGDGIAYEAQDTLQNDVLAVSEAAVLPDWSAASEALDRTATHLDLAATGDQVTSARYADLLATMDPVRTDIEAAIAAEEEQRRIEAEKAAEAQRQAEEQQRLEEQERLEEEQRQQEEDQPNLQDRLDDFGQGLRDRFDDWFGGSGGDSGSGGTETDGTTDGVSGTGN